MVIQRANTSPLRVKNWHFSSSIKIGIVDSCPYHYFKIPFKFDSNNSLCLVYPFRLFKLLFAPLSFIRVASPLSFKHPLRCLQVHGYQWTTCWASNPLMAGACTWPGLSLTHGHTPIKNIITLKSTHQPIKCTSPQQMSRPLLFSTQSPGLLRMQHLPSLSPDPLAGNQHRQVEW